MCERAPCGVPGLEPRTLQVRDPLTDRSPCQNVLQLKGVGDEPVLVEQLLDGAGVAVNGLERPVVVIAHAAASSGTETRTRLVRR